ncbi:MAG: ornithine cyclodeaminase [Candidatus Nanopelagicales bacterium]
MSFLVSHDTAAVPMRLLSSDDVDALATSPVGRAAAERAARLALGDSVATGRVQVNGQTSWMRILAGIIDDLDLLGYKEFHRVGQRVRYHIHLFRQSTGDPLGTVDGRRITGLRTASTAAVAVRHWAQGRPVRLGVIGSGEEAKEGVRAFAGALDVTEVVVYSPTPANREAFAVALTQETGVQVRAADDQASVLRGCDALYVATSSHHEPFLRAADLGAARFIAAIGSTMPVHRELVGDVFVKASQVVIDTPDAAHESGDAIEALDFGWDPASAVLLGAYVDRSPLPAEEGITLFKSIGSVEQDLVLASSLLDEAASKGQGTIVDDVASLRLMR